MRIIKFVEIGEVEVTIDLDHNDIMEAFSANLDDARLTRSINSIATFMKGVPDDAIKDMTPAMRKVIRKIFQDTANRFTEAASCTTPT